MNTLRRHIRTGLGYCAIAAMIASGSVKAADMIRIHAGSENAHTLFALEELTTVLAKRGYTVQRTGIQEADIVLLPVMSAAMLESMVASVGSYSFPLKPEGFSIRKSGAGKCWVVGADAAGVMYGGLDLAEQIAESGMAGIEKTDQNPYMEKRGIKFNIPLDVRTPSYSDMSEAGQRAIADVWDLGFWKEMFDRLARDRYNMISLWSLHPFPSMIKVPGYPDIVLADVKRSTAALAETFSGRATGYDAPDILRNAETVLTMSIDEKIVFWKKVMAYAKGRNIDVYIVTWNIYTYGTEGKYGITDDLANSTTKDYYRKSVKQLFLTYPDLAGIGITTGENMGKGNEGFEAKEDWVFQTYAQGVLDVVKEQPGRRITFIHRQHESAAKYITQTFASLAANKSIEFLYSYKYAKAHVFSSTKQSFHEEFVRDIAGGKTLWTLRNDDNYYFRWGAPDFVRAFVRNIPHEVSRGFYYGSDGYVWGRDFLTKDSDSPRQLEIARHWYHWMLWGRLGYNPDLSNERFIALLQDRFPGVDAAGLFAAWQEASMIYPVTTGFHWGALDYQWYIEGCKSRPEPAQTTSGFHDVNRFITLPPHRETGYQSIPDYVKMTVAGTSSVLKSPPAVSQQLHDHADKALRLVKTIDAGRNKDLLHTLQDIRSMAYLGKYYAYKISGATHLAAYRETKEVEAQKAAVQQLTSALEYWQRYTASAMQQYKNPLWTNRVGHVDWVKLTEEVRRDIEIAQQSDADSLRNQ